MTQERFAATALTRHFTNPNNSISWQCLPDAIDPCGPKAK